MRQGEDVTERSQTVLLVDDSPTWHRFVDIVLRDAGYTVNTTADIWIEELVAELKPGLILIDANLQEAKTGPELVRELNRMDARKEMRIYLFSSSDESELIDLVKQCGADGYIMKGVGPTGFRQQVQQALSTRRGQR